MMRGSGAGGISSEVPPFCIRAVLPYASTCFRDDAFPASVASTRFLSDAASAPSCRASSTTCTAESAGSPPANPPTLLSAERGDVEVVPGAAHLFVAAVLDEVRPEHAVSVSDEGIRAVPFVDAKVSVKVIGQREPWDVPAHSLLSDA